MEDKVFQEQIEATERALAEVVHRQEELRREFIPAAGKFAAVWWANQATCEVERTHSVTEKLSDEQLKQLKAEVQALIAGAEQHVEEFFADATAWWHLQPELVVELKPAAAEYSYSAYGNRHPDRIEKPLRLVLGKLGPVLEKYGYLVDSHRGPAWREWDASGNYHPPGARPRYPFSLEWPKELTDLVARYATEMESAGRLIREILNLRGKRKQAAAKKRWDAV